ncbi:MAG: Re/Si-specific NAD(P)(+) transhydrogenase subunit alpha [Bacteroidota bacterium]|nr:MAG: Re/Si-specific NAD(P)(+) transhydrogenase subunit alpha [Bacteroidota bacterium]
MKIGVLKEKEPEKRVALLPEAVKALLELKAEVLVERSAGSGAFVSDAEYEKAGAQLVNRNQLYKESDLIVTINPPEVNELKSVDSSKILIGALNPFHNKALIDQLQSSKLTSFSLELVPRITRAQSMDILSSMATVAGYKAVLDAAYQLPRFFPMFMSAAGTIKPARMLILGAGVAGLQALAIARKLGAIVEVFDVRSAVKEEVLSLGGKFVEVAGAVEDASAGGYAIEQSEDFKKRQAELIQTHARNADVILCTAQIPGKKAPVLVTKETVAAMKPGSLIIDLAASTGGNCELTEFNKVVEVHGVKIIGNSNYTNQMAVDASAMFGRNVVNLLKLFISEQGALKLDFSDEIIKGACLTHEGELMNERVKLSYKN